MGGGTGSPLMARTQVNIFLVIAVLVAIIAVLAVIYLIARAYSKYKQSPAYLEKQRLKPTTAADIAEVVKQCALSKEERDVLTQLCKKTPSPNIRYLLQDLSAVEQLIRKEFYYLDEKENEAGKTALFSLRSKLKRVYTPPEELTSSRKINIGTGMTYTVSQGFHYKFHLVEKEAESIILSIPQQIVERKEIPPALSKINLIFEHTNGAPYQMETRVVRYQQGKHGETLMVVMHSDQITPLQKRQNERLEMQQECEFASVAVTTNSDPKKPKIEYRPSPNMHKGMLLDVSTGGCRLMVGIPIKAEQFIYIAGKLNTKDDDAAIGTILRTTKRLDGKFMLHIKFVKISQATVNRIQAAACGY